MDSDEPNGNGDGDREGIDRVQRPIPGKFRDLGAFFDHRHFFNSPLAQSVLCCVHGGLEFVEPVVRQSRYIAL